MNPQCHADFIVQIILNQFGRAMFIQVIIYTSAYSCKGVRSANFEFSQIQLH